MLEVRLIGKFDVRCDGQPVLISSRAAQSLFAYLILTAGTQHRREKLAGMFWPDTTEEKSRAYLRHELWRIRKALSSKSSSEYLLADDIHLSFNPSSEYWLDVAMLTETKEHLSAEDLMNSLSVFQGELLPGFYEEWVVLEREHLQVVYEQKIAQLLSSLEKEKRWHEIPEWAEKWISFGQGSEEAYRYLMSAYDAQGDRPKVAAVYERYVQALRQFGVEPSEQIRSLALKRASRINLPLPLTSFIGREKELQEVAELLSRSRLVTLTGAGGVGKTRLSIQVVADVLSEFPDGIWFLDLASLSDPALIPSKFASLLGLRESVEIPMADLLKNYFHSRTALVIFDNCEHLVDACAQLIHSLLTSCEHLSILATSREALRVAGEIPYRVPSLALPRRDSDVTTDSLEKIESIRLFVERARVALPGLILDSQNAPLIAHICQRLDGIPLAIELAAARASMLSPGQILSRLDDRFTLLTGGWRTTLPRQQTLRAAIEWSYDLLSEQEGLLFRRLAVFTGGWTLEAAEDVCSGQDMEASDILDLLSTLVNKSLVLVENMDGTTRYRRLESIRQFAREKLRDSREANALQEKHLTYFLQLAEQAHEASHGPDEFSWKRSLEKEIDNFRAALTYCVMQQKTESALRLLSALSSAWEWRGHFIETCNWFDKICRLPDVRSYPAAYGRFLNFLGWQYWIRADVNRAQSVLEESRLIWLQLGIEGETGLAESLKGLGQVALAKKESVQKARSLFKQSFALFQKHNDEWGMSSVMLQVGAMEIVQGNYAEAEEQFSACLSKFQALGDKFMVAFACSAFGDLARVLGDYERAEKFHGQNLEIFRELGGRFVLAWPFMNLGWVSLRRCDYHRARDLFVESLKLGMEDSNKGLIKGCLAGLAGILAMTGKPEQAALLFGAAETRSTDLGHMEPADQKDFDHYVAAVRDQLEGSVFANAWARGQAMTLEHVISFALENAAI